jgi:hypothetical protein
MVDIMAAASKGQKAMRAGQSAAERVFWPLQAGRPRGSKPGLIEAVHIGRVAANRLREAVETAGLSVADAGCVLVLAQDGKAKLSGPFTADNQDSNDLEIARRIMKAKADPIGVAFCLIDREKGTALTHARPFERTEHAEGVLSSVLDDWEYDFKKGRALKFS